MICFKDNFLSSSSFKQLQEVITQHSLSPSFNSRKEHIGFRLYFDYRDFLFKYSSLKETKLEKAESIDMLRVIENNIKVK